MDHMGNHVSSLDSARHPKQNPATFLDTKPPVDVFLVADEKPLGILLPLKLPSQNGSRRRTLLDVELLLANIAQRHCLPDVFAVPDSFVLSQSLDASFELALFSYVENLF